MSDDILGYARKHVDKLMHLTVGMVLCGLLSLFIQPFFAFGLTFVAGISKELIDRYAVPNGIFDVYDLAVTIIGALFILIILIL
jgi:uncharacterized membrane protein YjjP (DUF1212 family)